MSGYYGSVGPFFWHLYILRGVIMYLSKEIGGLSAPFLGYGGFLSGFLFLVHY